MNLERESKTIQLFGRDFLLSERSARAVWDLEDYNKAHESKTAGDNIFKDTLVVHEGLSQNLKVYKWWEFRKRWNQRELKKMISIKYLIKNLSYNTQIKPLCKEVLKMDGYNLDKVVDSKKKTK